MTLPLIFEDATSPLYGSNDGRLSIYRHLTYSAWVIRDDLTGEEIFATYHRVTADAYIAGYDLATDATKSSDVPPGGDSA